jgi:hypothetical protein
VVGPEGLPEDPDQVEASLGTIGRAMPLAALGRLLRVVRARERVEPGQRAVGWTKVRAIVHETLAARGSSLGLYDLRDTLEAARRPLPAEFATALHTVGDRSCLAPMLSAYSQVLGPGSGPWKERLAEAFRAIIRRERLTGRHAIVRTLASRWPSAFADAMGASPALRPRAGASGRSQ